VIAEETKGGSTPAQSSIDRKQIPWLRVVFSLILSILGVWFLVRDVDLAEVQVAFARAQFGFVLLALATIAVTMASKAWRWQLLFNPKEARPSFSQLFWALSLGQLVNTAIPFLRLGEIARVVDLGSRSNQSRALALGTLVVEKTLDLIMLVLTLSLLLPLLVIPDFVGQSGLAMAAISGVLLLALIALAFRPDIALKLVRRAIDPLPDAIRKRAIPIVVAGLEGIASLRQARTILLLLLASSVIAFLSVLTPWLLFSAFDIKLGLAPAAAVHVVLTVGTLPPSTPAKVGIFEFLVAFMLRFFGVDNSATILTYTIIYHLVVVIPQIAFGSIAAARRTRRDGE
jgi:uncharacterized protein (TIRG00374 family)